MKSVEDEWQRNMESDEDLDLLFVTHDADIITVDELLHQMKASGFKAVVKK